MTEMSRPKNNVSITRRDKAGTIYDIWFVNDKHEKIRISRSTTTILKAIQHYDKCVMR
jgi:hypothetical protein